MASTLGNLRLTSSPVLGFFGLILSSRIGQRGLSDQAGDREPRATTFLRGAHFVTTIGCSQAKIRRETLTFSRRRNNSMDIHDLTRSLHTKNESKIVMLVADGLGGLPHSADGQTELEASDSAL